MYLILRVFIPRRLLSILLISSKVIPSKLTFPLAILTLMLTFSNLFKAPNPQKNLVSLIFMSYIYSTKRVAEKFSPSTLRIKRNYLSKSFTPTLPQVNVICQNQMHPVIPVTGVAVRLDLYYSKPESYYCCCD